MSFYTSLAEFYERIFPFRRQTYAFLQEELGGAGNVLDVGCGSGHYCGRLAAAGYTAVGIDPEVEMVVRAREKYPVARFAELGMEQIGELEEIFAGAFCIGNVAAHLPIEDWPSFLAELHARLQPGATWIVQTVNFDPLLDQVDYRFPDIELEGGRVVFSRRYRHISPGRLGFATRLVAGDHVLAEGEVTLYPAEAAQYVGFHEAAGFAPVGHYADFARRPFHTEQHSASVMVFRRCD